MNRRAAIELSANVIMIMVISSVILGLGLMLFFNLKGQAERYTDTIEQQTAEQLQALMLNDNSRVAIYPNDLTIQPGKSQMTTVAVQNMLDGEFYFSSPAVTAMNVTWFTSPTSDPQKIDPVYPLPLNNPNAWWKNSNAIIVSNTGVQNYLNLGKINPGEQGFKNILIKMPKTAKQGQYVITINIRYSPGTACNDCPTYGLVKLYITVP